MLASILAWIGQIISSVFSEVLKDVLKTPAKEIEVNEEHGQIDVSPTPMSELRNDYKL